MNRLFPVPPTGRGQTVTDSSLRRDPRKPLRTRPQDLVVSYVAERTHCYPGDRINFYLRVRFVRACRSAVVQVELPALFRLEEVQPIAGPLSTPTQIQASATGTSLRWVWPGEIDAGSEHEYSIQTTVRPAGETFTLESKAAAEVSFPGRSEPLRDEESVSVAVRAKSAYLRYMPALYTQDELMGRLLTLFESFWSPIDQQIKAMPFYFDPATTPSEMLPWLASWLDLVLDEEWPELQRRRLLRAARRLYAKRGTRVGMEEYLTIYTGGEVRIVEHRAENFRIRTGGSLGTGIALGQENRPHSFSVMIRLPATVDVSQPELIEKWRRVLTQIIDNEKPAHSVYTLHLSA
jgi:phage tail-like protein